MELIAFLKQRITLTDDMEQILDNALVRETFGKHHKLLPINNRSQTIFFLESGLARTFYLREDGKDITHAFLKENAFTAPIENIFYKGPSPFGIELIQPSVVRSIEYPIMERYIDQYSELERLIRFLLIDIIKGFSDRLYALQFQSAQERYRSLMEEHPDILQQAPLGHIASYLGITQQTLSVIRSQRA